MKKPAALGLLAFILGANIGCEQQSYEETKMFNQSSKASGGHGHGHGDEHGAKKAGEGHKEAGH
jgi:hypothetical protein